MAWNVLTSSLHWIEPHDSLSKKILDKEEVDPSCFSPVSPISGPISSLNRWRRWGANHSLVPFSLSWYVAGLGGSWSCYVRTNLMFALTQDVRMMSWSWLLSGKRPSTFSQLLYIEAHRRTTDYSRQTSNIVKYTKQHLHNGTSFCRRLSRSIQEWTYQIIPHHCKTEKIIPIKWYAKFKRDNQSKLTEFSVLESSDHTSHGIIPERRKFAARSCVFIVINSGSVTNDYYNTEWIEQVVDLWICKASKIYVWFSNKFSAGSGVWSSKNSVPHKKKQQACRITTMRLTHQNLRLAQFGRKLKVVSYICFKER